MRGFYCQGLGRAAFLKGQETDGLAWPGLGFLGAGKGQD